MKLPERPRVFLTGGGSGLGRALALRLAARQARVLVTDIDLARAEETCSLFKRAAELSAPYATPETQGAARAWRLDVTNPDAVAEAATAMDEAFGGVDVVINNAGVAVGGAVGESPLEDWRFIMDINLWGCIHGCHVFAPRLRAQKSGFVLNVASAAGFASLPEMGAYNVTKAGVIALSETLYGELRPHGVGVGVLCPTFFKTGLMDSFRSPNAAARKKAEGLFKKARLGADDVAQAAIEGLERGRLHILPMADARAVWRIKRLWPQGYADGVVKQQKRFEKWLAK